MAWFKEKVAEWNKTDLAKEKGGVEHEVLEDWGLLALQGTSHVVWTHEKDSAFCRPRGCPLSSNVHII